MNEVIEKLKQAGNFLFVEKKIHKRKWFWPAVVILILIGAADSAKQEEQKRISIETEWGITTRSSDEFKQIQAEISELSIPKKRIAEYYSGGTTKSARVSSWEILLAAEKAEKERLAALEKERERQEEEKAERERIASRILWESRQKDDCRDQAAQAALECNASGAFYNQKKACMRLKAQSAGSCSVEYSSYLF